MASLNECQQDLKERIAQQYNLINDQTSDPQKPGLSDMPLEVAEIIFNNLGWGDRCSVRKVSRKFRDVVDYSVQHFDEMELTIEESKQKLMVREQFFVCTVKYDRLNSGEGIRVSLERKEKIIEEKMCCTGALNDFLLIIKCPKVNINRLMIHFHLNGAKPSSSLVIKNINDTIISTLRNIKQKANVKYLQFFVTQHADTLALLPHLMPGALQHIEIICYNSESRIKIDELAELEQWKQAEQIVAYEAECDGVDNLFKLQTFDAYLPSISTNDFIRLKNELLKSPRFRHGKVYLPDNIVERVQVEIGMESSLTEGNLTIIFGTGVIIFYKI